MPTFFLVAGWLGARTVARAGLAALVRHRARRLVVPLAIFVVPMSLAMESLWRWGRSLAPRGHVPDPVPALTASELPITLGHLWYLYYLIALTAIAALVTAGWRHAPARWRAAHARAVVAIDRVGLVAPLAAVPTALILARADQLQLDTPLHFTIDPLILAYFGGFVAWGWWLGGAGAALASPWRGRGPLGLLAAALVIAALVPALVDSVGGARPTAPALAGAALSSWLLVGGLLDVCRPWRRPPAVLTTLAVASYWTYIVHLPLVIVLAIGASQLAAPGALELVTIAAAALAASLATFALVRRTPLGRLFT
jgi:peptidoglycan/LPS O-acetylase OafA/YrhL